ncbi:hypothetical protein G6F22_021228 [Rhizopus arrhizus]|nr:hypothetical protein G6F22_021228 [Rhizopus arrhizus]
MTRSWVQGLPKSSERSVSQAAGGSPPVGAAALRGVPVIRYSVRPWGEPIRLTPVSPLIEPSSSNTPVPCPP